MPSESLVYLTYGDVDSPVFRTQVIGFCDFLEDQLDISVQLVSFVPFRMFFQQKNKLCAYGRTVKVFPVVNRWQGKRWYSRFNGWLISRLNAVSVMTRNPVAAHVCSYLKEREWNYFYDARGCNYMELREFSEASDEEVEAMKRLETISFKEADWIYSVSEQLVLHFKDEIAYRDHNHSIVPCCYIPSINDESSFKKELFGEEDITIFCYAGALTVWNFPRAFIELCHALLKNPKYRLIILSNQIDVLDRHNFLQNPRCIRKSVPHSEVAKYLDASDYGILLRKKAVTNKVASPSKFADYLAAGCKVIISPELGDFTSFVQSNDCGIVYRGRKDNGSLMNLYEISTEERKRVRQLASGYFLRTSEWNLAKYRNLKKLHDGS